MKAKFLLGFAPLLAAAAFAAVPAAAQAAVPCWTITSGGACLSGSENFTATATTSVVLTDTANGLVVTSTGATLTGSVTNTPGTGESTITASTWTGTTINLPAPCAAAVHQTSNWHDQTDGETGHPGTYTDAITVPSGEGNITISGCTGAYEVYNGAHEFSKTVDGVWTNPTSGTQASLKFTNASGLLLGTDPTTLSGTFTVEREKGNHKLYMK